MLLNFFLKSLRWFNEFVNMICFFDLKFCCDKVFCNLLFNLVFFLKNIKVKLDW